MQSHTKSFGKVRSDVVAYSAFESHAIESLMWTSALNHFDSSEMSNIVENVDLAEFVICEERCVEFEVIE